MGGSDDRGKDGGRITARSIAVAVVLTALLAAIAVPPDVVAVDLRAVVPVLAAVAAACSAVVAAIRSWQRIDEASGWWLVAIAAGVWSVGWGEQSPNHGVIQSIARLAFYPLACLAVLRLPRLSSGPREGVRQTLDLGLIALGGGIMVWVLVGSDQTQAAARWHLAEYLAMAVPVAAVVLAVCAVHVVAGQGSWRRRRPSGMIAAAWGLLVVGDMTQLVQHGLAHAAPGQGMTACGIAAWAAATWASVRTRSSTDQESDPGSRQIAGQITVILAVTIMAVAVGVLWSQYMDRMPWPLVGGVLVMAGILVARLLMTLADAGRLARALRLSRDGNERLVRERTADLQHTIAALRDAVDNAERSRLAEAVARRLAEALSETAGGVAAAKDIDTAFRVILGNAARLVAHDGAAIGLVEGAVIRCPSHVGHNERGSGAFLDRVRQPIDRLGTLQALVDRREPVVRWQADGPALPDFPPLHWVRAVASVPLVHQDAFLGFISFSRGPGGTAFTEEDIQTLTAFARQTTLALANQLFLSEARARAQRLGLVADLTARISARDEVATVLSSAVEGAARLLRAERSAIGLLDRDGDRLTVVADQTAPGRLAAAGAVIHRAEHPELFAVLDRRESLAVDDPGADARLHALLPTIGSAGRAQLAVPVALARQALGILVVEAEETGRPYTRDDQDLATTVAGLVAVRIDQARRLAAETEARRQAEAASAAKSDVLANTSHELRTPLNGILGALDLVLDRVTTEPAEQEDLLRTARFSAHRLLETINGLLDLARIEAGHLAAEIATCDLASIAQEVVAMVEPKARTKALSVRLEVEPGLPPVATDARLARQVITNLIGNAVKFTDSGEVRISVRPGRPGTADVVVVDSGIGIAADQIPHLFRPFVQADSSPSRRFEGTGLGLSIARAMAEHLGGTLELSSAGLGRGTTAIFSLPAAGTAEPVSRPTSP
jgi:signal transduction histidine kinase